MEIKYSIKIFLKISFIMMVQMVLSLCICVAPVFADKQQQVVDKNQKKDIIRTISQLLMDNYVYPDLGEKYGKKLVDISEAGKFDGVTNAKQFGDTVTVVLQKFMNDKHINFRLIEASELGETKEGSLHHPLRLFRLGQNEHLGFLQLDWIEKEIGYLEYSRFYYQTEAKDMLAGAINFLSDANALIIDLRNNQGGSDDMIPLLTSYFLKHPAQLSGTYYRELDKTFEVWTLEHVEGERLLEVPLFLLIGKNTFSAAESFAYDMKVHGRATLIGELTKGGAHSVDLFKVGDYFEIYISTSRAVNPVTKSNWEGVGVLPDVSVPEESALDTARVIAKKAAQEFGKIKDNKLMKFVNVMQEQLDHADSLYEAGNDVLAEALLDSAFQTGIRAKLMNEFFIMVLAYHYASEKSAKMHIGILKRQINLFPSSHEGYESLAWAFYNLGEEKLAKQYFEIVLEMNPDNASAAEMLKKLNK